VTNQSKPFILPKRNPLTHARHRKEVFWQVTFPLIIGGLLLVAGLVALLVMTVNEARLEGALPMPENTAQLGDITAEDVAMLRYQHGTTARLSNVSQMWLVLPLLFFTLLTLAVLIGLVYLFTKLLGVLPGYMCIAQDFMALAAFRVKHLLDAAVEPVLKAKSLTASVRRVRQAVLEQTSALLGKIAGKGTE
jgi:hypothetical protein